MAWNEKHEKTPSLSIKPAIICPIFGENFKTSGINTNPISRVDQRVRILDLTSVIRYRYGEDPETFESLWTAEALPGEVNLREFQPSEAIPLFVDRVSKYVRLENCLVYAEPDPDRYEVLVLLRHNGRLDSNDYAALIPKRSLDLSSISRARVPLTRSLSI